MPAAVQGVLRPHRGRTLGLDCAALQRLQHPAITQDRKRLVEAIVQVVWIDQQLLPPGTHGVKDFLSQSIRRHRSQQTPRFRPD